MKNGYRLSFTAASLLLYDSVELARRYLERGDWSEAIASMVETPVSQRSISTIKRESSELAIRLQQLSAALLERLVVCEVEEARIILLYAILKTYPLIRSFCLDVLYEKSLLLDDRLEAYEINAFFREEEERQPLLEQKTEKTRQKLKQVLIKILVDANLIKSTQNRTIIRPYVDPDIGRMILEDGGEIYLKALLMNDNEITAVKAA